MNKVKLTKSFIDRTTYHAKNGAAYIFWDDSLPGFGIRIYPSGKKAFMLKYRYKGRQRNQVIGQYGALTLPQAKEKAKKWLAQIIDGQDPADIREGDRNAITMGQFSNEYLERYAKEHKKSWKEDERRIDTHIRKAWGTRKLESITRKDVDRLYRKVGDRGKYEANRVLALISRLFEIAKQWGYYPETSINPASRIAKYKEKKRESSLTPEQTVKLIKALEASKKDNLFLWGAIWMLLFTGCRKNEVLRIRWDNVNYKRGILTIPDTKAGRPHHIPITEAIAEILHALEVDRSDINPYVFPGVPKEKGKPLVNIDKSWRNLRKNADLEDFRLHDLRHNFGTSLARMGKSPIIIKEALNHATIEQSMGYIDSLGEETRSAFDEHSRNLMILAGKVKPVQLVDNDKVAGE